VNFWKRWIGSSSQHSRLKPSDAAERAESFVHQAKLVYLPPRSAAQVWKTRTLRSDPQSIWMAPPNDEWESSLPHGEPVTIYLFEGTEIAEFDSIIYREQAVAGIYLRVDRPPNLEWKPMDVGSPQQHRKFLRVDVSLPGQCSVVTPTLSGRMLDLSDSRPCRVVDLSLEGASLLLNFEPPAESMLDLKVASHSLTLHLQCKLIRATLTRAGSEFPFTAAISFINLPPMSRELISNYILERQKEASG